MTRPIAIIQARMGSSRLPGKVLMLLGDKAVLQHVTDRAKKIPGIGQVVVATSDQPADQSIEDWCKHENVACVRGPEEDVLARFIAVAEAYPAPAYIRLTADCPLLDPDLTGQVLKLFQIKNASYASNVDPASWPDGLDCEIIRKDALLAAHMEATAPSDREHVTPFIRRHRNRFPAVNLPCSLPGLDQQRWTLDSRSDFSFLSEVFNHLPDGSSTSFLTSLLAVQKAEETIQQDGNTARSSAAPSTDERTFDYSADFLAQAEKRIPLGSQTFSKSRVQYPVGAAPLFASHGRGGRIYDIDGNEYIDLVAGLLPVLLGYCDPDVDDAIRRQLEKGISFSLATSLELELAELIADLVPSAEMVRFGKNGSDATSGAVRIARAATGRDHIIACGYHGWQDWYIGSTARHRGVPAAVRSLTHSVAYNDLPAVEALLSEHDGRVAAIILEPMAAIYPEEGYLKGLRDLATRHGTVLVFDEVVTGFRFSNGGAQELFGVIPDLTAFGKAMGNGMPISAICGRADLMMEMEKVFYSGTFGGETLSLAASIATLKKIKAEPVIETIWETGQTLSDGIMLLAKEHQLEDIYTLSGVPAWRVWQLKDHSAGSVNAIKTLLLTQLYKLGVLTNGANNIIYAHNQADIDHCLWAYNEAFTSLAYAFDQGNVEAAIDVAPLVPVFQVRK